MPANGCIYWAFIGASVGSDTRGATMWEAAADVNIAVEAVLVGETLCQLEGRRTLPVHVGNPEPGGCWDGDTAWRMPRRQLGVLLYWYRGWLVPEIAARGVGADADSTK